MNDSTRARLSRHVARLRRCDRCPQMAKPVVSGGPVVSKVLLIGQAPGDKEPKLGRPFAWTAGKTLFKWFDEHCDLDEAGFRSSIYMAAVTRCFPGKKKTGGDRVPNQEEIDTCLHWLEREVGILRPDLVIPVGKLAMEQFLDYTRMDEMVGTRLEGKIFGHETDFIPLPHPSGASPWSRVEPGKTLVRKALRLIEKHPAFRKARDAGKQDSK